MTQLMRRLARWSAVTGLLAAALLLPTSALASAPTVGSVSAINASSTSVYLFGPVDGKEISTTYWFEYGPTTAYGQSTTHVLLSSPPPGNWPAGESVNQEFALGTTYHARLVASNKDGTTVSGDTAFVAPAFTAEKFTTNLAGSNVGEFAFNVENETHYCSSSTLTGQLSKATNSFSAFPTLGGCNVWGYSPMTFYMNSCEFQFNGPSKLQSQTEVRKGTMDIINCSEEIKLTQIPLYCNGSLTIPAQNGLGPVTYKTVGSGSSRKLEISITAQNLKYTCSSKTKTDGRLEGVWLVSGTSGGISKGVWVQ